MCYCIGTGNFERNFDVPFKEGFTDARGNAFAIPCRFYDIVNEFRYSNGTAGNVFSKKRSALFVVAGFDIVRVCVDIRFGVSDFDVCHRFFCLTFCNDFSGSGNNIFHRGLSCLAFLVQDRFTCFDLFDLFFDRVKIRAVFSDLFFKIRAPLFDLFVIHVFVIHVRYPFSAVKRSSSAFLLVFIISA